MNGGDGIVLLLTDSSRPFANVLQKIAEPVRMILLELAPLLIIPSQSAESIAWHRALVSNDCVGRAGETIMGHETVLGHSTTIVRFGSTGGRATIWMAPDLGCFALRQIDEEIRSDGTYRTTLRLQALKVTMNH